MKISIIVSAFNEEQFLGKTLAQIKAAAGALANTGWGTELIVCILLFVVAEMVSIGVTLGAQIIHPEHSPFTVGRLAVLAVLLISIINPVFEEVLETGYFIHSLQRFGMWPAVLASAVFRGLFHLQFGINTALSVFVMGVVFGFTYWRWRQLWPLVFAHSLMDLLALFYDSYRTA